MDDVSKSWFCVLNNPEEYGFTGEPHEIVDQIMETFCSDNPQRTCAVNYCISAVGLKHCHAVFEDTKAMRFTAIKKLFPSMHMEPTKGNKEQAEDYINKRGKWEEKGEIVVCSAHRGEIKGCQGQRRDLDIIGDLIQQGKTPNEILDTSFTYHRYESMIRSAYYQKRIKETPAKRKVKVFWHLGSSGSGKSYTMVRLFERYGDDNVYLLTDYKNGFDKYNGEPFLFMDEFRGQMQYAQLLSMLDGYRVQIPCRYSNAFALWNEVHITSVLPPEIIFNTMVQENRHLDTADQLMRRIDFIVYHFCKDGEYCVFELPMSAYNGYEELLRLAVGGKSVFEGE